MFTSAQIVHIDKASLVSSLANNAERLATISFNKVDPLTMKTFFIVGVHVMMNKEDIMFNGYHTV